METELPMSDEIYDVPPWRPTRLHFGVTIQFTEPDGRQYSASVGDEIAEGETLEKLTRRMERAAIAKVIGFGFPYGTHKQRTTPTGLG